MRKPLSKGVLILAGLFAGYSTISPGQEFEPPSYARDPRLLILKEFFQAKKSPIDHLAKDFLMAADRNRLDWRLLPSIAFVESSGGKAYRNNNIFGWDSCETKFPSIEAGIHVVASKLADSRLYKNKDLEGKLATYNPHYGYVSLVKSVMTRVSPDPNPDSRTVN